MFSYIPYNSDPYYVSPYQATRDPAPYSTWGPLFERRSPYLPDQEEEYNPSLWGGGYRTAQQRRQDAIERERERLRALAEAERQREEGLANARLAEKRRREIARAKILEEERRMQMAREEAQSQGPRQPDVASQQEPTSTPQLVPQATTSPQFASPSDEQIAAASKILFFFRSRKALSAIKAIEAQYDRLKGVFTFPSQLDFVDGDAVVTIEVPKNAATVSAAAPTSEDEPTTSALKLAYTRTNAPLHSYTESLSRSLVALDAVESWGEKEVREKRRAIVRRIEEEAGMIERRVGDVWYRDGERSMVAEVGMSEDALPGGEANVEENGADREMEDVELMLRHGSSEDSPPQIGEGAYDLSASEEAENSVLSVSHPTELEAECTPSGQGIVQTLETEESTTGDALVVPGARETHAHPPEDGSPQDRASEDLEDSDWVSITYVI